MSDGTQKLADGQIRIDIEDRSYTLDTNESDSEFLSQLSVEHVRDGLYSILYGGKSICAVVDSSAPNRLRFTVGDSVYSIRIVDHRIQLLEEYGVSDERGDHEINIAAPMPGLVLRIQVEEGETVSKNDPLLVLEAMKMENEIRAPGDGVVVAIHVKSGEAIAKNALLIELAPEKSNA